MSKEIQAAISTLQDVRSDLDKLRDRSAHGHRAMLIAAEALRLILTTDYNPTEPLATYLQMQGYAIAGVERMTEALKAK